METSVKILLVEDSSAEARLLEELLTRSQLSQVYKFDLLHVQRLGDALKQLIQCQLQGNPVPGQESNRPFDVILLDLTLPDSAGLDSLPPLMHLAPTIPIVVLTNTNDDDLAVEAVRQGAQDYLVKRQIGQENGILLLRSLRYAIERKHALENLRAVNQSLAMRVEERTSELAKVQEISQFKSEFVSMLSHDIRNPLNTILLAAGLLQSSDERVSPEKKHSHYELIRSAIKAMAQLLDEASFIGKADTGKISWDWEEIDLEKFCHQLLEEFQLAATEKNIKIKIKTIGEFEKSALWDETLLRHIIGNLLNNAIKYSCKDSQVHWELINQKNRVIIQIQDSGIGIPNEDLANIFQPFHRAGNVGSIIGTGLGLAIVKKCVDACGGEISVWSQVGIGTTFTVILPIVRG